MKFLCDYITAKSMFECLEHHPYDFCIEELLTNM